MATTISKTFFWWEIENLSVKRGFRRRWDNKWEKGLLIRVYLPNLRMLFVYGGKYTTHMKWNLKSFNFLCAVCRVIRTPHDLLTRCHCTCSNLTHQKLNFFFADCKFINYPPSMIAAGSVGAAAHGLLKTDNTKLLQNLHQILNIDVVGVCLGFQCLMYIFFSDRLSFVPLWCCKV